MSKNRPLQETVAPGENPGRAHGPDADGDYASRALERLARPSQASDRYEIHGEIARGGQGAVLRVRDRDLDRDLAMKVVLGQGEAVSTSDTPALDSRTLGRFLEEAQVTGRLDHPGIVPVHELGLDAEGRVYFTMKLVKGEDLRSVYAKVREAREGWTRTRALGVLTKVCEAMAYAHAKKVIHRDLKPGNVMVGKFGEVYVMDWGLARVMGSEDTHDLRIQPTMMTSQMRSSRQEDSGPDSPLLTMDGDVVGTPVYMSPEQAVGDLEAMGPHSDVYSLGAMLYELCAGHMPYVEPGMRLTNHAIWYQVQKAAPTPLVERAPDTPAELVAICERAMARDAGERYRDTSELAADLAAFLERRVVSAYETGAWAETRKWVQRNKPLAGSLLAAMVLLVVGLGTALFLREKAQANFVLAEERRLESEANEKLARENEHLATQRAEDVLRLSAVRDLEHLLVEVGELWPPFPENAERFRDWIAHAEALASDLPRHQAKLAELRALTLPRDEEQRARERTTHPEYPRLVALQTEIDAKRGALLQRRDGVEVELPEVDWSQHPPDPSDLSAAAWLRVDPNRNEFGGEPLGLALAERAVELDVERASERAECWNTLAWAYFAVGRDDDALNASFTALEESGGESRFERKLAELEQAVEAANEESAFAEVETSLAALRVERDALEERVSERREWRFSAEHSQAHWWHDQLTKLVEDLEALNEAGLLTEDGVTPDYGWSVPKRLAFAEELEAAYAPGGRYAERWQASLPRILAAYPGLDLTPQMGLVPIGQDPASGLWEFWHVVTGAEPARGANGELVMEEDSGCVLVLLPGGTFHMGAQSADSSAPNYDPEGPGVGGDVGLGRGLPEWPVHEVTLSPFFLSKFEMTQGQWLRLTGSNPSGHNPAGSIGNPGGPIHAQSLLHPVESTSWLDFLTWLRRSGLTLPSEAQWEYGCRAGTQTPWWTGSERESLEGAINVADKAYWRATRRAGLSMGELWPELDDGWAFHAPIGTYRANPFGLHEVHGNVAEMCLDGMDMRFYARSPVRDPVAPTEGNEYRSARGGLSLSGTYEARSAFRLLVTYDESGGAAYGVRPAMRITR